MPHYASKDCFKFIKLFSSNYRLIYLDKIAHFVCLSIMDWTCQQVISWLKTFIDDTTILSRVEGQSVPI